ncbi:MAG: response regulator [Nitrospiraceae bacterium]
MSLGKILVVDDDPDVRKVVRLVLTKAGYEVVEAEHGEQALQLMRTGDHASTVATILSDLQMPQVNGAELIAHFKAHYPTVPYVVMTGSTDFLLTEILMKEGVCDYVIKPVSQTKLLDIIRVSVRLHELRKKQALPQN